MVAWLPYQWPGKAGYLSLVRLVVCTGGAP